jgi:hypothetical protein
MPKRSYKTTRMTKAEMAQLDKQLITHVYAQAPISVRHCFYAMTNPRLPVYVPKTDNGTKVQIINGVKVPNGYRIVQQRLTHLRRQGLIDYYDITDSTRRGYHTATYHDPADFIETMAGKYRGKLWEDSDYVEVWCESRSIAGTIEDTCCELAVSLYPAGGFSSITLVANAAEYINRMTHDGERAAHIIYVGDYDPAGVLIDKSVEREMRDYHLHPDVQLHFHRLAITPEQIAEFDLPTKPRKVTDKRSPDVKETVEAEAMDPNMLRQLLRDTVESYLPEYALDVVKAAEESERAGLEALSASMDTGDKYGAFKAVRGIMRRMGTVEV